MPVNVSVTDRASVTAGLANEVDEVNQYAAVMYRAHGKWHGTRTSLRTSPDHGQQPEGSYRFRQDLRRPGSGVAGPRVQRLGEHGVRESHSSECPGELCHRVPTLASVQERPPCEASAKDTAGLRWAPEIGAKRQDQGDQRGARGQGVGEQCDSDISASQLLAHYSGPDHCHEQHRSVPTNSATIARTGPA